MQTTEIDPITAELLHAAVHELQGPAARLRLLAQLLARNSPALNEDARKLIGHIEASAAEAGAVADALRKYAEIGTRPLQREPLDLNLALGKAIANLRTEISGAGAQITTSKLPQVEGDPSLVSWLLQELLANAIRFGRPPAQSGNPPEELRVHVSSGAEAGQWFVSVADNGRGIEPAMVERVFRPFKKLEAGPSAGLGLTICRRIVERHEGKIWIETGNRGAEFRFFLGSTGRGEAAL